MTRSRILYAALALGVLAATAWDGFSREERQRESAATAPALPPQKTSERTPAHAADPLTRLAELRRGGGKLGMTPEAQAECWQIIRGLSEAQVQSCLADIPVDESGSHATDDTARAMLYSRWAQLNPTAAAERVAKGMGDPQERNVMFLPMQAVLAAWMKHDPETALSWAMTDQPDLPGKAIAKRFATNMAAELWVRDDPVAAVEKAKKLGPQVVRSVVDALSRRASASEADRQAFFTLRREQNLMQSSGNSFQMVGRNWALAHPAEALASEERYGMDDREYASFRSAIVFAVADRDPTAALDRMQDGNNNAAGAMGYIYQRLAATNPAKATEWVIRTQRADLLESAIQRQATGVIAQSLSQGGSSQPLQELARKYDAWSSLAPEAAAKWAATLPAGIRTQLNAAHESR